MKTKKHPIIKELLLGKTVEEVIEEHFSDYCFLGYEVENTLPEIIREIIRINDSNMRFVVSIHDECCAIFILNKKSELCIKDYWDDKYDCHLDDDAKNDCEILNEIVEKLHATKRKKNKPKLTNKQIIEKKGKICPYCSSKKLSILDDLTNPDLQEMGCNNCGETWGLKSERIITGLVT